MIGRGLEMPVLTPRYFVDLATQIGFLSAFFGGFAATMLIALLLHDKRQRVVLIAIGFATLSSAAFITTVIGATDVMFQLHPDRFSGPVTPQVLPFLSRVMVGVAFPIGIYSLFGCIGASGWIRSRATGFLTTAISAVAVVCVSIILLQSDR